MISYNYTQTFDKAFTYEGKTYLPMSISYTGGRDEWAGEWVEFKVGSGGTSKINRRLRRELVSLPKSNRLPDDERLEDRIIEIKTGTSRYQKGIGGVTSVALLNAARYDLWSEGDKVNIIDPVIGYVDELTLTADVNAGDCHARTCRQIAGQRAPATRQQILRVVVIAEPQQQAVIAHATRRRYRLSLIPI